MNRTAWDRRRLLSGAAAALCTAPASAGTCTDIGSPRALSIRSAMPLGQVSDVLWGPAIGPVALKDARYMDLVASERPRFLAIADGLKFGNRNWTGPAASDAQGWTESDDIVAYAVRMGIPVRGDCLAWNDFLPDWVKRLAKDRPTGWRDTLRDHFDDHFRAVFTHFDTLNRMTGKRVMPWAGVVNEPFNPWLVRDGLADWHEGAWLDAFGIAADGVPGYIHRAFELGARYAPPGTTLFVNETFCEDDRFSALVRPRLLGLIDSLQAAGRTVGAVGLECHLMPQWIKDPAKPDWRGYVAFLRELSARGVAIYLTELDVNDCSRRGIDERDALVASYMRSFVTAALDVPAVTMISTWGLSDFDSWWRDDTFFRKMPQWAGCVSDPECPRPLLYDAQMQPKPARDALATALASRRPGP